MIPILYDKTETTFSTNGLGRLGDCISCYVLEQRNGQYELEMKYPVSGVNYGSIQVGRIIAVTHDEAGDIQPFDIYKISEPINGVVTINAYHISYRLNEIVVKPFSATSCSEAISAISTNSMNTNPFTFSTDKNVVADYDVPVPTNARALLGGEQDSILDVYGTGEYEFDVFDVTLHLARGGDTEVSIKYGKNLVDFLRETDISSAYNGVAPYWKGTVSDEDTGEEVETLVTLTEGYVTSGYDVDSGRTVVVPLDLSGEFETVPTEEELRTLAQSKLAASYAWRALQNITVDFVQLWQTEEYAKFAPLQTAHLCDTVLVDVPQYGITGMRIKIISVTWDALLERYSEMELGDPRSSYADTLTRPIDNQIKEVAEVANAASSAAMAAVTRDTIHYLATNLSTGVTTNTPGWTTTIQTMSQANRYLWTYHTYGKANGGTVDTSPVLTGVYGEAGASVTGITELYALNDDPDNPPVDSDFTANVQTPSASQRYLWNMERITFSNGNTSNMGKHILLTYTAGIQGRGISSVTEYYAINNSTTAPATSAFTTTVQIPTSSNPYVWNYEVINYTDGLNPTTTDKRIIGVLGQNGTTVSSVQYGTSSSASTNPTNWSTTAPSALTKGTWLWVKTNYSDSTSSITKSYIGTDGDDGTSVWVKSATKSGATTTVVLTNGTTDTTLTITDGQAGANGINGVNGLNGYVHTAWANSADGSVDFSTTVSEGKEYLGVYTNNIQADSTNYYDYSWSLIKGEDGVTVTSVQYGTSNSASTTPSNWSTTVPTSIDNGKWLWVKTNYSDSTDSITKSYIGTDGSDGKSVFVYSSTKVGDTTTVVLKDTDGETTTLTIKDGDDGDNGTNGLNGYVHTAWANSADGSVDFSTSVSSGKSYLGVYTDNAATDSQSYSAYSWTLIKGANGTNGADGVSVTKVEPQYYMSTSSSSLSGGSWSYQLSYISGRYIWTRDEVTYSNNTTSHSTAIYNSALTTAWINAANAYQIASDTEQHYWFTDTGNDTGAHITEATQTDFLADPQNGGGNLLARSNGIAIRKGLDELATFTEYGVSINNSGIGIASFGSKAQIGSNAESHVIISKDQFGMFSAADEPSFTVTDTGETRNNIPYWQGAVIASGATGVLGRFPLNNTTSTVQIRVEDDFGASTVLAGDGPLSNADVRTNNHSEELSVSGNEVYGSVIVTCTNSANSPYVTITAENQLGASAKIWMVYERSVDIPLINFSGDNNLLWSGMKQMSDTQYVMLNQSVSEQLTGIALVWTKDDYTAPNVQFIPKDLVRLNPAENADGVCVNTIVVQAGFANVGTKSVYVTDTAILGHAYNVNTSGSASSISPVRSGLWYLAYVFGV